MTATSESVSKEGDGCPRFAPAYRAGNDFFQSLSQKDANEAKAARCGKSNGGASPYSANLLGCFLSKLPQNRHPGRAALRGCDFFDFFQGLVAGKL